MNTLKAKEFKEKTIGQVEEILGKMTDNKPLEVKGKVRKGMGKAYEAAGDSYQKTEEIKDTVVGTVKEQVGKLTHNPMLAAEGKIQKEAADKKRVKKIIGGLSVLALTFVLFYAIREEE